MAPLSLCLLPTSRLLLLSVLILLPRMQLSDLALGDLIQTEDFTSVEGICEWPSNLSPDLKHIMLSLEALGYLLDLSTDISQSHHIWDKNLHFLLTLKNTKGWPFMWWKVLTTCLGNKPFWKFYLWFPVYRWQNWDTEKWKNLPRSHNYKAGWTLQICYATLPPNTQTI